MNVGSKIYHSLMLSKEIEQGIDLLESGEYEEAELVEYLNGLELKIEDLMEDLCSFVDESKSNVALIKDRKTLIDKRKKSLDKQIEQVRSILTVLTIKNGKMVKSGAIQFKTVGHTISVTKEIDALFKLNEDLYNSLIISTTTALSKRAVVIAETNDQSVVDITIDEILDDSGLPRCLFDKLRFTVTHKNLTAKQAADALISTDNWEDASIMAQSIPDADIIPLMKEAIGQPITTIFDVPNPKTLSESEKAVLLQLYKLDTGYKLGVRG